VFELEGATLYLKAGTTLDFETKTSYSVTVNVDDAAVGSSAPDASNTFTLSVNNVNENLPPIAQNDLITTDANTPIDFNIFADNGNGPDSDPNRDTFRVSDTDYPNNFRGNVEVFFDTGTASYDPAGVFDYLTAGETATSRFTYTITDGNAISNVATVTITVTGVNDKPTDLTLSNTTIAENSALGTVIGSFSTVDPDTSNTTFTYSLVDAANFSDNSAFTITNNQLKVNAAFNFESDSSYSIKVRTTDQDGGFYDEVLTIGVTNVNEAPTVTGETVSTSQNTGNPVTSVTVELGDNLSDPDANGLANAILNVVGTTNGTIASIDQDARLVSFTPTAGFSGTASFNYTLTDAGGLTSNAATVTIDVGSVISTGNRNQEIEGNNGDDIISAGNGSDRILGLGGNDRLFGNNGNDILTGGDGNDSLFGGNGTDTLLGDNGNDLLDGGNGADIVTGGAGSDRFVLTATAGRDTFTDFADTIDRIALSGGLSFGQLTIADSGGNTAIQLGNTTLATLTGVNPGLITAADFVTA
jgi:VCBS repeat-containing protein